MKKVYRIFTLLTLVLFTFLGTNDLCSQTTINVPTDQPTIQAAVDAAITGDIVHISAGNYPVSTAITVDKDITIEGEGDATLIQRQSPGSYDFTFNFVSTSGGATLSNMKINGESGFTGPMTSSNYTHGYIVNIANGADGVTVENVSFENGRSAVLIYSDNVVIKDCYFTGYWMRRLISTYGADNVLVTNNIADSYHYQYGLIVAETSFSGEISYNYVACGENPGYYKSSGNVFDMEFYIGTIPGNINIIHNTFDTKRNFSNTLNGAGVYPNYWGIYFENPPDGALVTIQDNIFVGYEAVPPPPPTDHPTFVPTGGQFGGALLFDGSDDAAFFEDLGAEIGDEGTLSVWVRIQDMSHRNQLLEGPGGDNLQFQYRYHSNGQFYARTGDSESTIQDGNANTYEDIWVCVQYTWDQTNGFKIYLDGSEVSYLSGYEPDYDWLTPPITSTGTFTLGWDPGESSRFFEGYMDDFALFDAVLDQTTMDNLRTNGVTATNPSNLVAYWPMDDAIGSTVATAGLSTTIDLTLGSGGPPDCYAVVAPANSTIDNNLYFDCDITSYPAGTNEILADPAFYRTGNLPEYYWFSSASPAFNSASDGTCVGAFQISPVVPVVSPTPTDNDFTVIQNAVTSAPAGYTVDIQGTFDWTETNAYNSYIASTSGDIRGVEIPDVSDLTITSSTDDAQIIGPGDINDGALIFSSCFYHKGNVALPGLTVEKIHINNFEACITLSWDAYAGYDGTTIQNNTFTIAGDDGDATDWIQNIAVYFGKGENQSIINNNFNFKANGTRTQGYSGPAPGACFGFQSATNPNGYNGLSISGNTFEVLAGSVPANITYGIWENSHSDNNDQVIHLDNNEFNGRAGDDFDRAFMLSSQSEFLTIDANIFDLVDNIYWAKSSSGVTATDEFTFTNSVCTNMGGSDGIFLQNVTETDIHVTINWHTNNTIDGETGVRGLNELSTQATHTTRTSSAATDIDKVFGLGDMSQVAVDDDWGTQDRFTDPDGIGTGIDPVAFGYNTFNTIQEGIDAVSGSTVFVAPGTYVQTAQLVIDKDLTLKGSGKTLTTIEPGYNTTTGSYLVSNALVYVDYGVTAIIEDIAIDGSGYTVKHGIQSRGADLTVRDCDIRNIYAGIYSGRGIVFLTGTGLVEDCEMSNIQRIGIHIRGNVEPVAPDVDVTGFTYTGKGAGDWLDYGVEFGGGGKGSVDDSYFSDCLGVASTDNSTSAGVLVTDFYGTITDAEIMNSTFTNCSTGIYVGYAPTDASLCTAYHNSFLGSGLGIKQVGVTTVDAEQNYWETIVGAEIEPKVEGSVDYIPWCNSDFSVCDYGAGGGPAPVTTIAEVSIECAGDAIVVPVTVTGFNNVGAISLVLNYDHTNISLASVDLNAAISSGGFSYIPSPETGILTISYQSATGANLLDDATLFTMNFDYIGTDICPNDVVSDLTWNNSVAGYCEYAPPGLNEDPYVAVPFEDYFIAGSVGMLHTTPPAEVGGPVPTASTVECAGDATPPTTLPDVEDVCGTTLSPTGGSPYKHSLFLEDFSTAVTTGATQAPGVWYTDRYAPAGFVSPVVFDGDDRLKQSLDASDGENNRPAPYNSSFYNYQGRKYDLGTSTDYMAIDLYIDPSWETTNWRMASIWGTAVNSSNAISGYPIIEFTSDDNDPRFRIYESGVGYWVDLGLPTGFTYDAWYTLEIKVLPNGEFFMKVGDLTYITVTSAPEGSVRLTNVILQGHNPGDGLTYDIYWDDFKWNDTYADPACEGFITYTFNYEDCSGLVFPWMYTYTVEHSTAPVVPADGGSTVYNIADAVAPALPTVTDVCGVPLTGVLESVVDNPDPFTYPGTRTYTYSFTDCADLSSEWKYVYTIPGVAVSGEVTYYKNGNPALNNITVTYTQGSLVKTTTTDIDGLYSLSNLAPGAWDVTFSTVKAAGGINSTDAAQVNFWSVNNSSIQIVRWLAGNVREPVSPDPTSYKINAADAGLIQQYFLTLGNPTPAFVTDWSFWKVDETISANPGVDLGDPQVAVSGSGPTVTQNFYGLATGDFNRSFTPGTDNSGSESLTLEQGNMMEVHTPEFELPVYAGMDMNVGAVSLILDFPSDKLQVEGVYLGNDPNTAIPYKVYSNELLISWHSLTPVSLQAGDRLVTLQLTLDATEAEEIFFSLAANPLNELADESYEVIRDARLIMDGIKASALGMNDLSISDQLMLTNHPNPFNGTTSFEYTLPADGRVVLEVYDVIGNKVGVLIDEAQTAGTYVVKEDLSHLQPGYYTVAMKLQSRDHALTRAIKIICR